MSNSSRVTVQRGRKRLMPAGIEHMLVHLTGAAATCSHRVWSCIRGAIQRRFVVRVVGQHWSRCGGSVWGIDTRHRTGRQLRPTICASEKPAADGTCLSTSALTFNDRLAPTTRNRDTSRAGPAGREEKSSSLPRQSSEFHAPCFRGLARECELTVIIWFVCFDALMLCRQSRGRF